jgi:acyl-CoA dehydrogenase
MREVPGRLLARARREAGVPEEFVGARTEAGYLGALIPEEYGGLGLDLVEASIFLEEINRSGGNAQPAHAQVYTMGTLLRHGSEEQKREILPKIASGEIRLQAFGVTEPEAGTDTTSLSTTGRRSPDGDRYVVNGRKMYISRVRHSDYMILLARTTPRDRVERKSEGLSVFIFDLREAVGNGLTVKPRRVMINNETNELLFEDLEIPASGLIGEEGKGFRYVIDGMNAERILIAAECIGNGRWFVEKATRRATEREVFGRPIGQN